MSTLLLAPAMKRWGTVHLDHILKEMETPLLRYFVWLSYLHESRIHPCWQSDSRGAD